MPVFGQQSTIGFIGAGAVGGTLAVALEQASYRVVAVASRTWASAHGLAQRLAGCTAYTSPQQVVDACELVFISTPDDAMRRRDRMCVAMWARFVAISRRSAPQRQPYCRSIENSPWRRSRLP